MLRTFLTGARFRNVRGEHAPAAPSARCALRAPDRGGATDQYAAAALRGRVARTIPCWACAPATIPSRRAALRPEATTPMPNPFDPRFLADLAACAPAERPALWSALAAAPEPIADLHALEAALAGWDDAERCAPTDCFAQVCVEAGRGPMDAPTERFVGWRAPPLWPWTVARAARLHFEQGLDAAALRAFPQTVPTGHLRRLFVRARLHAVAAGAGPLLAHPGLAGLRAVSLDLLGAGPATVAAALAALPSGVRALHLAWVRGDVGDALGRALYARPALRALHLHHCALPAASWTALGASGALGQLDTLRLYDVPLDDHAAAAWAQQAASGALRDLVLEVGPGGGRLEYGLCTLADGGWLSGLRALRVSGHGLRGAVFAHIREVAEWSTLRTLEVEGPGDWTGDAEALLDGRARWPALHTVRVGGRVGRKTAARLDATWPV